MSRSSALQVHEPGVAELLGSLSPEATALLATVVTNEDAFNGVRELRDRFRPREDIPGAGGRMKFASSVAVDPAKWRRFFWVRRMTLSAIGPMMEPPRCGDWGSSVGQRARANFYSLDAVACAMDMRVEDLIAAVGTEEELERLALSV